jgi:hypothetical protein
MTKQYAETEEDIEDVATWACVVRDVIALVPHDKRGAVLAFVAEKEEAERKKIEDSPGGFVVLDFTEFKIDYDYAAAMRLRSLVVQALVRNIRNNNSPEDADALLSVLHPFGDGSGVLKDYLPE